MATANRLRLPRALGQKAGELRGASYPWQLVAAAVSWILLGVVVVLSRIGAVPPPDEQTAKDIANDTGGAILASTPQQYGFLAYLPWLGAAVVLVALALFLRQGWARLVLAVLGLVAVIALALGAQVAVFPVLVLWVAGSVLALTAPAHRFLTGRARASVSA